MKFLLFLKKHWLKIFNFALIFAISFYAIAFGFEKAKNLEIFSQKQNEQTIISIWHIETFEGGGKARIEYLKTVAKQIEKDNKELLFMIKSVSPEKLKSELTLSIPDIVSFGFGVGNIVLPHLIAYENTFDVRDELISSGSFNKKFFAVPFIMSGYAIFNHSMLSNEFHVGTNEYIKPETIYESMSLKPQETESQYEAYIDFVYNKNVTLLGTGRDLFRINNLNNLGRTNAMIQPVDTYTDLIQYLGITNQNKTTLKFINLALSNTYQTKLKDYSLFSSKYDKIYSNGIYNDMENAILSCKIPNVFYA